MTVLLRLFGTALRFIASDLICESHLPLASLLTSSLARSPSLLPSTALNSKEAAAAFAAGGGGKKAQAERLLADAKAAAAGKAGAGGAAAGKPPAAAAAAAGGSDPRLRSAPRQELKARWVLNYACKTAALNYACTTP